MEQQIDAVSPDTRELDDVPEGWGMMHVLNNTGDSRHVWDPANADQVEIAKGVYDSYKKKGYAAFKSSKGGEAGEQIREFDPTAGRIVFVPQLRGGACRG